MRHTHNAQADIIGIVLIVIILVVSLVMFYSIKAKDSQISKQDYLNLYESQALLNTIMKADSTCGEIRDTIKDCYNKNKACINSCDAAKGVMQDILASTLKEERKPFLLMTSKEGKTRLKIENGKCDQSLQSSTGIYFIPSENENIKVELTLCKPE